MTDQEMFEIVWATFAAWSMEKSICDKLANWTVNTMKMCGIEPETEAGSTLIYGMRNAFIEGQMNWNI